MGVDTVRNFMQFIQHSDILLEICNSAQMPIFNRVSLSDSDNELVVKTDHLVL
jgi:hypothetical protein